MEITFTELRAKVVGAARSVVENICQYIKLQKAHQSH